MAFAAKPGPVSPAALYDVGHAPRTSARRLETFGHSPVVRRAEGQVRAATWPLGTTSSMEEEKAMPVTKALSVGSLVLVAGSTGGVGQLTVERLLESGFRVRAVARDTAKAEEIFGANTPNLEVCSPPCSPPDTTNDNIRLWNATCAMPKGSRPSWKASMPSAAASAPRPFHLQGHYLPLPLSSC